MMHGKFVVMPGIPTHLDRKRLFQDVGAVHVVRKVTNKLKLSCVKFKIIPHMDGSNKRWLSMTRPSPHCIRNPHILFSLFQ